MGGLFKLILVAALALFGFWFLRQTGIENAKGEEANGEAVVLYWGGTILCAFGLGVLMAFSILPKLGEIMVSFFYSAPSDEVERTPHSEALARIAVGDYVGAVAAYEKAIEKNPEDVHALIEISKLHIEKLGDPAAARSRLEVALDREWSKENVAPLMFRLADIYWREFGEIDRARLILEQILDILPNSTHAANATIRLREIEQSEREREELAYLASVNSSSQKSDFLEKNDNSFQPAGEQQETANTESIKGLRTDASQRDA